MFGVQLMLPEFHTLLVVILLKVQIRLMVGLRDFLWAQSSQFNHTFYISVWFNLPRRSLYLGIQSYVLI
jgi:hypothetical protein